MLPREKLTERGVDALSDTDLMAIIIGTGMEGLPVRDVARRVCNYIEREFKPRKSSSLDGNRFMDGLTDKVDGIGRVKAMQILCSFELGRRVYSAGRDDRVIINSRKDVVALCRYLKKRSQEHVVVIALNARNELVGKRTVAIGSLNKSIVEARDIFSWALKMNAAGIIVVHNHPSGETSPSSADERFTKRIRDAGTLLGVELIDHVIV